MYFLAFRQYIQWMNLEYSPYIHGKFERFETKSGSILENGEVYSNFRATFEK